MENKKDEKSFKENVEKIMQEGKEVKPKKINFFKKVWYSITNFEKYVLMSTEGVRRSLKYLMQIVSVFVLIIACIGLYDTNNNLNLFVNTIEEKVPDFRYSKGVISLDNQETENQQYVLEGNNLGLGTIIIDIQAQDKSEIAKHEETIKNSKELPGKGVIILKDKIIQIASVSEKSESGTEISMTYDELLQNLFGTSNLELTKKDILTYLNGNGRTYTFIINFFSYFIAYFIIYISSALVHVLVLGAIGYITGIISKIKLRFSAVYSMSIYAFTLSNILNMIYFVLNYFAGITIKYFNVAYIAIAYVYLITVIFLIKTDFFKKEPEAHKKQEEQKKGNEDGQEQI